MHPAALSALVNDLGIPTIASRVSAIREHVLEMSAPVVADDLGRGPPTVTIRLDPKENSQAGIPC